METESIEDNPVVSRYVQSLYKVAKKCNKEQETAESLAKICEAIKSQKNYTRMLSRFSLMPNDAIEFIEIISKSIDCSEILLNFLKILATNKRFGLIENICYSYQKFLEEINGTKTVFVTYAKDFSEKDRNNLVNSLKEVFKCDNVECVLKKDLTLIDGIQIRYKSRMLDYSVKSKLARLHEAIRRGSYAN